MQRQHAWRVVLALNIIGVAILLLFLCDVQHRLPAAFQWVSVHRWVGAWIFIAIYAAATGTTPCTHQRQSCFEHI